MSYNPLIHHRRSIRLKGYDYSQAGLYFITIVCQDRAHLFGKIKNGEMVLNDAGCIADECWLEITNHFPNVVLREFVVMPNHIHGIVELKTEFAAAVGANHHSPPIPIQTDDGNGAVDGNGAKFFRPYGRHQKPLGRLYVDIKLGSSNGCGIIPMPAMSGNAIITSMSSVTMSNTNVFRNIL